jgi:hypothetical protein
MFAKSSEQYVAMARANSCRIRLRHGAAALRRGWLTGGQCLEHLVMPEFRLQRTVLRNVSFEPTILFVSVPESRKRCSLARKKPGHEIHCGDSHADPEDGAGQHSLTLAFAISKHQAPDDGGHERIQWRSFGEGSFENIDRVLPWAVAVLLCMGRYREQGK